MGIYQLGKVGLVILKTPIAAKGGIAPKGWITQASKKGGGTILKTPIIPIT